MGRGVGWGTESLCGVCVWASQHSAQLVTEHQDSICSNPATLASAPWLQRPTNVSTLEHLSLGPVTRDFPSYPAVCCPVCPCWAGRRGSAFLLHCFQGVRGEAFEVGWVLWQLCLWVVLFCHFSTDLFPAFKAERTSPLSQCLLS